MTIEILSFIMGIAGFIIICLLTIIGFFARKFVNAVYELNDTVVDLKICVEAHKIKIDEFSKSCTEKHGVVDKRLDNHSGRLNGLERNFEVVKAKRI